LAILFLVFCCLSLPLVNVMDWLPHIDLNTLHHFLMQAPIPEPKSAGSAEVELLKSQLEFLKADHARLAADFAKRVEQLTAQSNSVSDDFKTYLNYVLGLIAAATGLAGWFGFQSLEQAKKTIQTSIDQRLSLALADMIDRKMQMVKRTLDRESVVSTVLVDYLLLDDSTPPKEYDLLGFRGFQNLKFCAQIEDLRKHNVDIVIIDLENWKPRGLPLGSFDSRNLDQQQQGAKPVEDVLALLANRTIVVVYVRGVLNILNNLQPPGRVIPANSPVTLLGNVAEAAYVASAITAL
jgi:hypothetical protein